MAPTDAARLFLQKDPNRACHWAGLPAHAKLSRSGKYAGDSYRVRYLCDRLYRSA